MRTKQPAEATQRSRRGPGQHPPPEPTAPSSRLHLWLLAFLPVASFVLPPPHPAAELGPAVPRPVQLSQGSALISTTNPD